MTSRDVQTEPATILLTGFEPFDGETTNPSWSAVQELQRTWTGPEEIRIAELPVDFAVVDDALTRAIDDAQPDIVLCVGQAGGISELHVERVAINVDDARIPDNKGWQPIDEAIVEDGPAAYWSTLPIKAAVAAIREQQISAVVSQTAGTYTCNHVFYRLMHTLQGSDGAIRGGFVHVPYSPEQTLGTDTPSMPIETMARGLAAVLTATLASHGDAKLVGGALH